MKNKLFVICFTVVCTFLFFSCQSKQPSSFTKESKTNVVTAPAGDFRGVQLSTRPVELFAGIPYAQPPVGDLRWKEPQPLDRLEHLYEADHFQPRAMQSSRGPAYTWLYNLIAYRGKGDRTDGAPISEDCLYLNIWRPEGTAENDNLPVIFYIHGGSLTSGSSWWELTDGATLASRGVIMVTIDYRLNVFGYLALPELASESPNGTTGNYGLLDQIAALQWVYDNISSFGGNPENITIAGESAGSSSVNAVCASPLASGLFKRAIAESSGLAVPTPPHTFRTMEAAVATGRNIQKEFNAYTLEELRSLPADKLLATKYTNSGMTVDGYALPKTPWEIYQAGENNEEALLNGFNRDEADVFTMFGSAPKAKNYAAALEDLFGTDITANMVALYPARNNKEAKENFNRIISAYWFSYQHHAWTQTLVAQGKPVYEYYFSKDNPSAGAFHSGELIYLYGNVPKGYGYKKSDYALQDIATQYIINFAATGNPNGPGLPEWQAADGSDTVLELGETVQMVQDPFLPLYPALESQQERLSK